MEKESRSDTQSVSFEEPTERAKLLIVLVDVSEGREPIVWRGENDRPSLFDRLMVRWVRGLRDRADKTSDTTKGPSS